MSSLRITLYSLLVSMLFVAACGATDSGRGRNVELLLSQLQARDSLRRDSARLQLENYLFLRSDLPNVYEALNREYPDDDSYQESTRSLLFKVLQGVNEDQTVEVIRQLYPTLPENPDIRLNALMVLSGMNTEASVLALRELMLNPPINFGPNTRFLLEPLFESPKHLDQLYPEVLSLLDRKSYRFPLLELLAAGLGVEAVDLSRVSDSLILVREVYRAHKKRRDHLTPGSQAALNTIALMEASMTCLAAFPDHPASRQVMRLALEDTDPAIRLSALMQLIKHQQPGVDSIAYEMAADFRFRSRLYRQLEEHNRLDIFPEAFKNQQALAESDLAEWLNTPQGRGRYPDELRLMAIDTLEATDEAEEGRLFLFSFTYGRGWMAGLSGPQPIDTTQLIPSGYLTNSLFKAAPAISVEEHINELSGEE